MEKRKIVIGADHAGYEIKEKVKKYLVNKGHDIEDLSEKYQEGDDYPDVSKKLASKVVKEKSAGILVCGSGIGSSIAANKIKGARAALAIDKYSAEMARTDNDANILCLRGRKIGFWRTKGIVNKFLQTKFSGEERHMRRINKIENLK